MKREIKFRGLADDGKWYYGYFCINAFGEYTIFDNNFAKKVRPETVGQYTGLKDKNGKEIWEGNIVNIGNAKRHNDKTNIAEIRWFRGGFMLHLNGHFGFRDIETYDNDSELYEVIGDIYENPELLTK